MGYCPQEMALVELLTAREHIELFCEIRCIKREHINAMVEELITCMDLAMNKSNLVGRYSGGNKRKLMVAVAMCGEPQVIFLDEPSAGMDPAARRSMWEIIRAIKQRGCSVVLTTHSMEEAEALANRLAIMHEGRIRCIGNPQ
jgi:ATP-binding cassette subfamily A (ABC1) protein 3